MRHVDQPSSFGPHQPALELLPWWVNGTLDRDELELVEGHLAVCQECGDEELSVRQQLAAVRSADDVAPSPNPVALGRTRERIEAYERQHSHPRSAVSLLAARGRRIVATLFEVPRAWRWVLAAQLLAIALLVGLVSSHRESPLPRGEFYTLADPVTGAESPDITVVFDPAATELEIRRLLREIGGEVAGGPSSLGVYRIRLTEGHDDPVDVVVSILRSQAIVRFAEARPRPGAK